MNLLGLPPLNAKSVISFKTYISLSWGILVQSAEKSKLDILFAALRLFSLLMLEITG